MKKNLFFAVLFFLTQITFSQVEKPVYDVKDFGAKGDGITNDQKAIQKAIDACSKTGGTVVMKNGTFLTGQLLLVSNLTLQIDKTATL